MKKIDIIILHFGDIQDTKRCIESIENSKSPYRSLIVVNNDPLIEISKMLDKKSKRIYINTGANMGFAAGVNRGITYALDHGADYIALANNDTTATSDFITPVIELFEQNPKVGIASPVIAFKKNSTQYFDMGGNINTYTGKTYHTNTQKIEASQPYSVQYVSGCCMIIKRAVLERIGLFDVDFFLYYEDVDFCLRATAQGFSVFVVPSAIITHELSKTVGSNSQKAVYHLTKSAKKFGKKYRKQFPLHTPFMIWQSFIFILKSPNAFFAVLRGWK